MRGVKFCTSVKGEVSKIDTAGDSLRLRMKLQRARGAPCCAAELLERFLLLFLLLSQACVMLTLSQNEKYV